MFFSFSCMRSQTGAVAIPTPQIASRPSQENIPIPPLLQEIFDQFPEAVISENLRSMLIRYWSTTLVDKEYILPVVKSLKDLKIRDSLISCCLIDIIRGYYMRGQPGLHPYPIKDFLLFLQMIPADKSDFLDDVILSGFRCSGPSRIPAAARALFIIYSAGAGKHLISSRCLHTLLSRLDADPNLLPVLEYLYRSKTAFLVEKFMGPLLYADPRLEPWHASPLERAHRHMNNYYPEHLFKSKNIPGRDYELVLQYFYSYHYQLYLGYGLRTSFSLSKIRQLLHDLEADKMWLIAEFIAKNQPEIKYADDLMGSIELLYAEQTARFGSPPEGLSQRPPQELRTEQSCQHDFFKIISQSMPSRYPKSLVKGYFAVLKTASIRFLTELSLWIFISKQPSVRKKFEMASLLYLYDELLHLNQLGPDTIEESTLSSNEPQCRQITPITPDDRYDIADLQIAFYVAMTERGQTEPAILDLIEFFKPDYQIKQEHKDIAAIINQKKTDLTTEKLIAFLADSQRHEVWRHVIFDPQEHLYINQWQSILRSFKSSIAQRLTSSCSRLEDIENLSQELLEIVIRGTEIDIKALKIHDIFSLVEIAEHEVNRQSGRENAALEMQQWYRNGIIGLNRDYGMKLAQEEAGAQQEPANSRKLWSF